MNERAQFNGKIYLNPVPTTVMAPGTTWKILKLYLEKQLHAKPSIPPGPFFTDNVKLSVHPANAIRVTWLGHSGSLIEIDGQCFMTDPLWYQHVSPVAGVGPKRFFDNPVRIANLPQIDRLLISHDHYDHLDRDAVVRIAARGIDIICLLGVKAILTGWGIPATQVTELDWWQDVQVGNCTITALPSRHFSGRSLLNRFSTLWGSYAIKGPQHNVYFGADSGYYDGFKKIGDRLGPFDLTMLDTGAYNELWMDIHMGPENAVQAHQDLRGKMMMPIHWGTFNLARHPWTEPVERVMKAAQSAGVKLLLPEPGQTVEVGEYVSRWWERYG